MSWDLRIKQPSSFHRVLKMENEMNKRRVGKRGIGTLTYEKRQSLFGSSNNRNDRRVFVEYLTSSSFDWKGRGNAHKMKTEGRICWRAPQSETVFNNAKHEGFRNGRKVWWWSSGLRREKANKFRGGENCHFLFHLNESLAKNFSEWKFGHVSTSPI